MIGWLNGIVLDKIQPGRLVMDVNGVGYDVETSLITFFQIEKQGKAIGLHIHTIVREDALLLYGFLEKQERELFRSLIKVNGIGPKLAMSILSSVTPEEFISYMQQENSAALVKLPGIGKKTASRLFIEMRDSLKQHDTNNELSKSNNQNAQTEAVLALEALGYKNPEALKMVAKINDGQKNCEQLIREALSAHSKL